MVVLKTIQRLFSPQAAEGHWGRGGGGKVMLDVLCFC